MFVIVGVIGKKSGLKGKVFLKLYTDLPEKLMQKENLTLIKDTDAKKVHITSIQLRRADKAVVKFKEFKSAEDAEKWKNAKLMIPEEEREELQEDEFYFDEIIGLEVWFGSLKIGIVDEVLENQLYDIFKIVTGDEKEVLVPYYEEYIESINLEEGKIYTTDKIRNLLEIYR